jgi:hypothetical protein
MIQLEPPSNLEIRKGVERGLKSERQGVEKKDRYGPS